MEFGAVGLGWGSPRCLRCTRTIMLVGWCLEFGPQIVNGCQHPMVAGSSSCTCSHCDVICRGRFSGCVDVWANGPRSVTVRVTPNDKAVRRGRATKVLATAPVRALATELHTSRTATGGTGALAASAATADASTLIMLDHVRAKLRELESAIATHNDQPPPHDPRLEAIANAVCSLARGLNRLAEEVRPLQELPKRLTALEGEFTRQRSAPIPRDQGLAEAVARLAIKVSDLDKIHGRIAALERAVQRTEEGAAVPRAVQQLEQWEAKVTAFEQFGSRMTASERAECRSTDAHSATMADRLTGTDQSG